MLKTTKVNMVEVRDWDELVSDHYGRVYHFQQQDGCKERGMFEFSVPYEYEEDYENDTVPEIVNHDQVGVSFSAWLSRDPEQNLTNKGDEDNFSLDLWWRRNFYPDVSMIIEDLHKKGIIEEGEYIINIDW